MPPLDIFFRAAPLLLICVLATRTDLKTGMIPNRITLGGIVLGLAANAFQGGVTGVTGSVIGLLIVALPPLILFYLGAMGGGDVKLFGAVGSIIGASAGMEIQMLSFVFGACFGVVLWVRSGVVMRQLRYLKSLVNPLTRRRPEVEDATRIRFAPFVLLAAVVVCVLAGFRTAGALS